MSMNRTLKLAAGLCLAATTMWAQLPQAQVPTQKMAPAKISMEQAKKNFEVLKAQNVLPAKSMKMNSQVVADRSMKPMTGILSNRKNVMTRAGEFGAYYELPAGLYNIKSGFQYRNDTINPYGGMSRHGILAPIFQDVTYKNASTGATYYDWYINDEIVDMQEELVAIYLPGSESFYTPMPMLTAYDATGKDSIYQYGYSYNRDTQAYDEGQAVTDTWGMVHNLDAGAETFYNTYIGTMNGYWTQMLFGSHDENKASYFEIFEKPFHPVVLNSLYLYVATPVGNDISSYEFSVDVMVYDETAGAWSSVGTTATGKPYSYLGSMEECDIWNMQIYFNEPMLVDKQFALILSGPQDGNSYWAFLHQDDRDYYTGNCTAGYIPSTGDYAGYLMPYAIQPTGATEPIAYPASIDLGLQIFMTYNMVLDPATYDFLNYGDIQVTCDGVSAPAYLWNWEAYIMGSQSSMTITSDVDWLRGEVTRAAADDNFLYEILITADALPEGGAARTGTLTFTDGQGYQSTWTFQQLDATGIENVTLGNKQTELDYTQPIFDVTGRRVNNPTKGIYLQNGKKFVVE